MLSEGGMTESLCKCTKDKTAFKAKGIDRAVKLNWNHPISILIGLLKAAKTD